MTYKPWTDEEDAAILANYRRFGMAKTRAELKFKRSQNAIRMRASKIGASTPWKTFKSGHRF